MPVVADLRIVDGDTIELGGETIRINGIGAPEAGQVCTTPEGGSWRCGEAATDALSRLTDNARTTCTYGPTHFLNSFGGQGLSN